MAEEFCRLCFEKATFLFKKRQLLKYDVSYYLCSSCHSLQTETPYWSEEAYHNLSYAKDTGMVERTLFARDLILALALEKNFTHEDVVADFGGGTGLLTRMLRDFGLNAFWNDKYAKNIFAIGFEKEKKSTAKLVTAFEVFEHLTEPKKEIAKLFENEPEYILFSTKLYQGQDTDWWYFLEDGQHVQFYSKKGLEFLARSFGYYFYTEGSTYHLFSKRPLYPKILQKLCQKAKKPKLVKYAKKSWPSRIEADHKSCL